MQDIDSSDDDPITGINVTPLVDITLVLLIIFMVTARLISEPSFGVNLPKSSTAAPAAVSDKNVFLTMDEEKRIFLDGQLVTMKDLGPRIAELLRKKPDMKLILRADKRLSHGEVMTALDKARAQGVTEFGIAVEGAQ